MKKKIRVREKREREFGDIGRDCTTLLHLDWCLMFFGSIISPLSLSLYRNIGRVFVFFKREKMLSSLKRSVDIF